jgi:hypothetical protein
MISPSRLSRIVAPLCLALLVISGRHAVGSSPDAWEQFRAEVERSCVAMAAPRMKVAGIRVDPTGTASFGVALLTDAATGAQHICVYDKETGKTELGGALEAVTDPIEPFSPQDATQLSNLPAQVKATLDELKKKGLSVNGQADTVEALLDGRVKSDDLGSFPTGPYRCDVFWYGFLDEGARRVGTHTCSVSRAPGGNLVIEKTSGEHLNAETVPIENGQTAFAGRTWIDDQPEQQYDPAHPANAENDNFGNKVGRVLRSGERLFLVSIDQRGMTEPDPTYFEILELIPQL